MLPLPFSLARKWLRTLPAPAESVLRIAVREVEERIPTIDELGNPRTVIRTSTLASFRGPTGVVEIEQARRHTLPGFGHVYPIAHNEYVVFRDHKKLRADPQMAMSLSLPVTTNVLPHSEQDVEYPEMLPGSRTALQAQDSVRRHGTRVTTFGPRVFHPAVQSCRANVVRAVVEDAFRRPYIRFHEARTSTADSGLWGRRLLHGAQQSPARRVRPRTVPSKEAEGLLLPLGIG